MIRSDEERKRAIDAWVAKQKAGVPQPTPSAVMPIALAVSERPIAEWVRETVEAVPKRVRTPAPKSDVPASPKRPEDAEMRRTHGSLRDLLRCWESLTDEGRRAHLAMVTDNLERRLNAPKPDAEDG